MLRGRDDRYSDDKVRKLCKYILVCTVISQDVFSFSVQTLVFALELKSTKMFIATSLARINHYVLASHCSDRLVWFLTHCGI